VTFRVVLLAFVAAAILPAQTDQCLIRGQVTDTASAAIGKALISVYPKESTLLAFRGKADYYDGTFCVNELSPGTYTVKAWSNGFRAKRVHDVVVRRGETTDLRVIRLEIVGCDAREVMCCLQVMSPEEAARQPTEPVASARTDLNLPRACGADLSEGWVLCHDPPAKDADMVFVEEHGALLLRPVNGALIDPGCKAAYLGQNLRVDGLGKGDDLCVKTRNGHTSHVFFEGDDVLPGTTELKLWIVTTR
jgi:Carboxypeptidase regulatory-like domain